MQERVVRSKRERTRSQLVDAALRLYGKNGVDASLSDIALEASMASGTIYNYYDTKEKMLLAVRERLAGDIAERIFVRAEGVTDAAVRVAIGCLAFLNEARVDHAWASACLRLLSDRNRPAERFERDVVTDVRGGLASGRFTVPSIDVGILVVSGTVIAAMGAILQGRDSFDDGIVVESIMRGLGLSARDAKRIVAEARSV